MLGEEFLIWSADLLSDITLITVSIHVTNLGYPKDDSLHFIELFNSGTKKSNKILVGLGIAAIIPETDEQVLWDQIESEAERTNKKKEKPERCRQRKINLV